MALARCPKHGTVTVCRGMDPDQVEQHLAAGRSGCDPSKEHCPKCGRPVTELSPENV